MSRRGWWGGPRASEFLKKSIPNRENVASAPEIDAFYTCLFLHSFLHVAPSMKNRTSKFLCHGLNFTHFPN